MTIVTEVTQKPEEGDCGLHIRLERGMQPVLKQAAELAYEMGDTQKPDLVDLFNLYIGWGLSPRRKSGLTGWDAVRRLSGLYARSAVIIKLT